MSRGSSSAPGRGPGSLTPVVLHTLLTLVDGELHGYAIAGRVEERTDGTVRMGPGTLYGTLHRLLELGLVEECAPAQGATRRRTYRLTGAGTEALRTEARRLEDDLELLRAKNLVRGR